MWSVADPNQIEINFRLLTGMTSVTSRLTITHSGFTQHRNLKTSKALLKSQAHQCTSLFTSATTNQRGFFRRVVKRSSGPISRIPGEYKVAVKVGVVQMSHDQKPHILFCF